MSKNWIFFNAMMVLCLSACQPAARKQDPKNITQPTATPADTTDKSNPKDDAGKDDTTKPGDDTSKPGNTSNDDFKDDASFTASKDLKAPLKKFQIARGYDYPTHLTFSVEPKEANGVKSFAVHAALEEILKKRTTQVDLELTAHDANLFDAITSLVAGNSGLKSVPPAAGIVGAGSLSGKFITVDGKKVSMDWPALDGANQDKIMSDLVDLVQKAAQAAADSAESSRDMSKPDACIGVEIMGMWKYSLEDKKEVALKLTFKDGDSQAALMNYDASQDLTSVDQAGKSSTANDTGSLKFDQKNCVLIQDLKTGGRQAFKVLGISETLATLPGGSQEKRATQMNLDRCKDEACKESTNEAVIEINRQSEEVQKPVQSPNLVQNPTDCSDLTLNGAWNYTKPAVDGKSAAAKVSLDIQVDTKATAVDGQEQYQVARSTLEDGKTEATKDQFALSYTPKACMISRPLKDGKKMTFKITELLTTISIDQKARLATFNREVALSLCEDDACAKVSDKKLHMIAEPTTSPALD
ncbi:MAG: hypothetical protein JST80_01910 [Bdellovibrionales bacterium]|nr:hypothetical protein [Bdellovibrionales bacterium]